MAKTITNFGVAICRKIEPTMESTVRWGWRQSYIGFKGKLLLCESEKKHPGDQFLYFSGVAWTEEMQDYDDWYLRTGYGKLSLTGNLLTFKTQNSIYTFELIDGSETS